MIPRIIFVFLLSCTIGYGQYLIQPKTLDSVLKTNGCMFHKEFTYLAFCESGLQNKNLFGMHHPKYRHTYSIAKYGQVARFDCIEDCVKDFLIWYNLALPNTQEAFISYLKNRAYNPNPAYYTKLEHVIKKNIFNL